MIKTEINFLNTGSVLFGIHLMNYDATNADTGEFLESGTMLSIGLIFVTVDFYWI